MIEIATYCDQEIHDRLVEAWDNLGAKEPLVRYGELTSSERLDVPILFGWKIPIEVIHAMPRLAWIQGAGAGLDWLPEAIPDSVTITRMVNSFGTDMAEYVLMALLNWVKDFERVRQQQSRHVWEPFLVGQLAEMSVGILGAGSIGRRIAEVLLPVVGEVRAMGRHAPSIAGVRGFGQEDREPFFRFLDALVMVLPATKETSKLVGPEELSWMNVGSYVINIGRGSVLDIGALQWSINQGHTGGATLDVFDEEPLGAENPLWDNPRVHITPHIAGPSRPRAMANMLFQNWLRFRLGEPLLGVYERERGY